MGLETLPQTRSNFVSTLFLTWKNDSNSQSTIFTNPNAVDPATQPVNRTELPFVYKNLRAGTQNTVINMTSKMVHVEPTQISTSVIVDQTMTIAGGDRPAYVVPMAPAGYAVPAINEVTGDFLRAELFRVQIYEPAVTWYHQLETTHLEKIVFNNTMGTDTNISTGIPEIQLGVDFDNPDETTPTIYVHTRSLFMDN
jgi:hypothetical protein